MGRRLLSIWLPRLASETALRARPVEGAFALTARVGHADQLHCLNPAAERAGLRRAMPLADARALCPDLVTRPADPAAEAMALEGLRRWAARYAPHVARDGADGLIADMTGVAHLFGGEAALREDLHARLARAGLSAGTAIAETTGAAHALARHGGGIVAPGALVRALSPLPVGALRIDTATAEALNRLGLKRIGDLLPLPRQPLARRFGTELALRLDQALGLRGEPVAAPPDAPRYAVRLVLPDPIGLEADVMAGLARLLDRLCATLARDQAGARRLRLEMRRVDRATEVAEIGLAQALRDPARIARLFAPKVAAADAGFGIDALRLVATVTEPLAPAQVQGRPSAQDAMADLVSRLGNRMGFDSIRRVAATDSLIPERSSRLVPALEETVPDRPARPLPPRPALIFPPEPVAVLQGHPPERFRWRTEAFSTWRATGPERIAPDWWAPDPAWDTGLRDYWRIETREGPRLWLFHTPQSPAWAIQGEFP